jgi:iron complex transport system ATP-binding protein
MTHLELSHLKIGYGGNALAEVTHAIVRPGEFISLLGRNGQGKSTLLQTIGGFIPPVAGQAILDGKPVRDWSSGERARRIAVVLTERPSAGMLKVSELVEIGRQPYTGWAGTLSDEDRKIAAEALSKVGAEHLTDRMVGTLSDGERQRVMIARALAQQPSIMLLDEITAFLDLPSRVAIIEALRRIVREQRVIVILSSHDLELSMQMADRLWLLPGGGHFIDGAPEDIALSGAFGDAFDQPEIAFSIESGRFELKGAGSRAVRITGDPLAVEWAKRAAGRSGWKATNEPGVPLHIEASLHDSACAWVVRSGAVEKRCESLSAVVKALEETRHESL